MQARLYVVQVSYSRRFVVLPFLHVFPYIIILTNQKLPFMHTRFEFCLTIAIEVQTMAA